MTEIKARWVVEFIWTGETPTETKAFVFPGRFNGTILLPGESVRLTHLFDGNHVTVIAIYAVDEQWARNQCEALIASQDAAAWKAATIGNVF